MIKEMGNVLNLGVLRIVFIMRNFSGFSTAVYQTLKIYMTEEHDGIVKTLFVLTLK